MADSMSGLAPTVERLRVNFRILAKYDALMQAQL